MRRVRRAACPHEAGPALSSRLSYLCALFVSTYRESIPKKKAGCIRRILLVGTCIFRRRKRLRRRAPCNQSQTPCEMAGMCSSVLSETRQVYPAVDSLRSGPWDRVHIFSEKSMMKMVSGRRFCRRPHDFVQLPSHGSHSTRMFGNAPRLFAAASSLTISVSASSNVTLLEVHSAKLIGVGLTFAWMWSGCTPPTIIAESEVT